MSSGERDLQTLLQSARPTLHSDEFVYCALAAGDVPENLEAVCMFREAEGLTLIVDRAEADRHFLQGEFPCRMITLNVHSALDAVGFLAAVMTVLSARGISTNTVSAFYHDHLFVPADRAEEAMEILGHLEPR